MTKRPQRTCVGCRRVDDPAHMRRYVLVDGVVVSDPTGAGRGAYVHPDEECWKSAVAGGFARSFRRRVRITGSDHSKHSSR
ncbi:YlxR family protein [Cutibacterium sp.]|uniref:YlxR family protein n=1 Tax=Cutibacterium sp. TaxID=1912221 RepID=UPI0026DAE842|nr:YlxR family protein [Cutibacterium sp.]MDO4412963.1 YlxR family protein [Cutibacterium sp.]